MADQYIKLTGKLDRRGRPDEGNMDDVTVRENFLSRDGRNVKIAGTTKFSDKFEDRVYWEGRYYSDENEINNPKTFAYTRNGKLWTVDSTTGAVSATRSGLNPGAFPRHWSFKWGNLTLMFLVDGKNLYLHNGNNSNVWDKVKFEDNTGQPNNPIDVIEHKDRLCVISEKSLFISKNLDPEIFDDPTDSIEIVVGSGKAKNLSLGKIEDTLFILTTEGIYRLSGDQLSAVAETFSIELVEEKRILSTRSACKVEKSIMYLGDDLELWSFNGIDSTLMSYSEKISDYINPERELLNKAVAVYDEYNKYYMLSVVETGETENNIEFIWDTLEKKIDIIRGRNVSCYMCSDTTREKQFIQLGRSDDNFIMWANRERNFDGKPIECKLRSKDITPKKGYNVRFGAFYPEIEPTGQRNLFFRYLLDGRLSDLGVQDSQDDGSTASVAITTKYGTFYTALSSDNLKDIWVLCKGTGGTGYAVVEIWSYAAGLPDALLGTSNIHRVNANGGWQKFDFTAFVALTAGTKYGLTMRFSSGTTVSTYYKTTTAESFSILGVGAIKTAITTVKYLFSHLSLFPNMFTPGTTQYANFIQDLSGEAKTLGYIRINNQSQATDRVRPRINYARGQSVTFEIYSAEKDSECIIKGIGYDIIAKGKKKNKLIGA